MTTVPAGKHGANGAVDRLGSRTNGLVGATDNRIKHIYGGPGGCAHHIASPTPERADRLRDLASHATAHHVVTPGVTAIPAG
jgi:hypothetical protein